MLRPLKYLAWAFVEGANFAQRFDGPAQRFYQRKKAQRNNFVATKALACKLAKAAWHVMSKQVDYDPSRLLGNPSAEQRLPIAPQAGPTPPTNGGAAGQAPGGVRLQTEVDKAAQKQAGEKRAGRSAAKRNRPKSKAAKTEAMN